MTRREWADDMRLITEDMFYDPQARDMPELIEKYKAQLVAGYIGGVVPRSELLGRTEWANSRLNRWKRNHERDHQQAPGQSQG